jgi:hypothetical protein
VSTISNRCGESFVTRARRAAKASGLALAIALAASVAGCDTLFVLFPPGNDALRASLLRWNEIAINTAGLDHSPVNPGESRTFGHQLGPCRSSRAMAIVHIAMFDAVNATTGRFQSYTRTPNVTRTTSVQAAIAQAAHDTLVALYPSHAARLAGLLAQDLAVLPDGFIKQRGIDLGRQTARAILTLRQNDGSEIVENYVFSNAPGKWRQDPLNPTQQPLGPEWFHVKPFVMNSATQFRAAAPPSIDTAEYAAAYNEVKTLGGDGIITPTTRTQEQTNIGIFWAYDGTPSLCAPPRMYNQITRQIATERGVGGVDLARLLALVNVSMADAGIAVWESKYFYNYWRPVTGIRESDPGTGPTGLGDGNAATVGDPAYVPLCAPASNLAGNNFTPPFPAYPSGHAGFGGALFQTLRNFFGTDQIAFTFVSDELNGVTRDNLGNVRPLLPRSFTTLSQAEEENGQSRIYLGIHWSFDKTSGIMMGNQVANHVANNAFQPVR